MVERREDLGFPLETAHSVYFTQELVRQDFDRHFAFQLQIAGAIDLSHAALAEQRRDFVRAELRTNRQSHDFGGNYRTKKAN